MSNRAKRVGIVSIRLGALEIKIVSDSSEGAVTLVAKNAEIERAGEDWRWKKGK